MNARRQRFSRRHGLARKREKPLIFDDAPRTLRVGFLGLIEGELGYSPSSLRKVVCRELKEEPNPNNWSEYPNIWVEVQNLVFSCEWYEFFDIVESFASASKRQLAISGYEDAVNDLFEEEGIGWVLLDGQLEIRGDEPLDEVVTKAFSSLEKSELEVASDELSEAWSALSRRPSPNISGAIMHAMNALEAVAREYTVSPKETLGDIIKRNDDLFPKPLDKAVSMLWGYASNNARHGNENRELDLNEAFLVVGVSAALVTYLVQRLSKEE